MPSSIAHASVAVLASPLLDARWRTSRVIGLTAAAAAAPDLDAIGRPFGYGDVGFLGHHRGLTHSLFAALVFATIALAFVARATEPRDRFRIALFVFCVVASHGLVDAFTTYGDGVAIFAPFSWYRWKSPWQPFGGLWSEVVALWVPAALMYVLWLKPRLTRPSLSRGTG
jgi:inner membrane protein